MLVAGALGERSAAAEPIWARAAQKPADRAYDASMTLGDRYARQAAELSLEAYRDRATNDHRSEIVHLAQRAAEAYEAAAVARPRAGEPHFRAGLVLYAHVVAQTNQPEPTLTRRAIAHWIEFERLAPRDPRLPDVYGSRSLAYTKLGGDDNYRLAVADYDRELAMVDASSVPPDRLATLEANAAEMLMGIGELDRAITQYRAALELIDIPLHGFGLAVALDRDGQAVKAREIMRSYLEVDRDMTQLRKDLAEGNVFFVPDGEVNYYFALGHEAVGQYALAANYYRMFLKLVPTSRWVERARANLAVCEKHKKDAPQPVRKPPPKPADGPALDLPASGTGP